MPEKTSGKTGENALSRCAVAQGPLRHGCGRHQSGICVVPFIPSAKGTGGVTAGFRGRSVISSRLGTGTPQRCGKAPYIFLHEPAHRSLPNAPPIIQLFSPQCAGWQAYLVWTARRPGHSCRASIPRGAAGGWSRAARIPTPGREMSESEAAQRGNIFFLARPRSAPGLPCCVLGRGMLFFGLLPACRKARPVWLQSKEGSLSWPYATSLPPNA